MYIFNYFILQSNGGKHSPSPFCFCTIQLGNMRSHFILAQTQCCIIPEGKHALVLFMGLQPCPNPSFTLPFPHCFSYTSSPLFLSLYFSLFIPCADGYQSKIRYILWSYRNETEESDMKKRQASQENGTRVSIYRVQMVKVKRRWEIKAKRKRQTSRRKCTHKKKSEKDSGQLTVLKQKKSTIEQRLL